MAVSPSAAGSKSEEPAPAFATIKLKKVQRPADYDGKVRSLISLKPTLI